MKKRYLLLISILFISISSFAQTILLSENFTTFDATADSTYNGWYISYYGTGSFYTSNPAPAGSAGPSGPNTYKFGRDSATAITPMFDVAADSVHWFMKGNPAAPADLGQSTFYVYESPDSVVWTPLHIFLPPMDTAKVGSMQHFALTAGTQWLKFFYDKDMGNVAFDDFKVTSSTIGITSLTAEQRVRIFPTPTNGKLNINFGNLVHKASFSVINMLGKPVMNENMSNADDAHSLNLSNLQDGIYFLTIKADHLSMTKRIIVKH